MILLLPFGRAVAQGAADEPAATPVAETAPTEPASDPVAVEPTAIDPGAPEPVAATGSGGAAPVDRTPPREVPDYDSRAPRADDAVDALLWIPRILTGPLYLVAEYVIRVPLGALVTLIEENHVIQDIRSFLTFGTQDRVGVIPTALYEFGFLPSAGLYAFWNDFLADHNRISLHAATWGEDWLSLAIADRATIGSTAVFLRGAYLRRPDHLLGSDPFFDGQHARLRYASERVDGEIGYELRPPGRSLFGASILGRWARFADTTFGEESVVERVAATGEPLPTGFADGYATLGLRIRGALDTRDTSGAPAGGVRLAAHAELFRALRGLEHASWVLVGGELFAATDALEGRRTLSVSIQASAIMPFGGPVPFDQTIDVGGRGPLLGFLPGELRGLSALAVTLAYDWPIWLFANARLFVATGNAFGLGFEGCALERLRLTFGLAFRPNDAGEHPIELSLAFGTDTFEHGTNVSSVRFALGARNDL